MGASTHSTTGARDQDCKHLTEHATGFYAMSQIWAPARTAPHAHAIKTTEHAGCLANHAVVTSTVSTSSLTKHNAEQQERCSIQMKRARTSWSCGLLLGVLSEATLSSRDGQQQGLRVVWPAAAQALIQAPARAKRRSAHHTELCDDRLLWDKTRQFK
jgi:hypothetical protein